MNDWLSEIVKRNEEAREELSGIVCDFPNETEREKMARVLRELMLYISQIELHLSEADVILERIDVCLSPEAKELLRST